MLRQTSKGWLAFMIAGAMLIPVGGLRAATAEEPLDGKLIAAADSKGASTQAMPEASAQNQGEEKATNGGEKISVTFEEPEKDIMTKEALEKTQRCG